MSASGALAPARRRAAVSVDEPDTETKLSRQARKRVVRRMLRDLKPFRRKMVLASLTVIGATLARLAGPLLISWGIDDGIGKGSAGLGTVTHGLALAYRRVLALEPTAERVRFMHRRFAEERLANVDVIQGSLVDLPLRRESVDLAVLNGVLGWAACGAFGRRARATRRRMLESVRTVTRPGGVVYLGVGNRWTFGGGSVRQRAVWASLRSYRRLLEAAGYSDVRIWCALPSHDDPQFLVAYEQRAFDHFLGVLAARPRSAARQLAWNLLNSLGLLKQMTRSYCIVGRRGPGPSHAS